MKKKVKTIICIAYLVVMFSLIVHLLEQPFDIFHRFAWVLIGFYVCDLIDVTYKENRLIQALAITFGFYSLYQTWSNLYTMLTIPSFLSMIFTICLLARLLLCFVPWKQWKKTKYRGYTLLRNLPLFGMGVVLELLFIESGNMNSYGLWLMEIFIPILFVFFELEDLQLKRPTIWMVGSWISHLGLALMFLQMIGQI